MTRKLYQAELSAQRTWPRKNYLGNGHFLLSQRGGAAAMVGVDNAYGPDRWRMVFDTGGATPPAYTTGLSGGIAGSGNRALTITLGTTGKKTGIFQPIEGIHMWDLRGQPVSLQLLAANNSSPFDGRIALLGWTGTEDAVSADPVSAWGAAGTNPTLSGSWAYINTPTANMIASSGSFVSTKLENVTIPTNVTNLGVLIWNDSTTYTIAQVFLLQDIQLEKGQTCTSFEREHLSLAYLRMARYYWKSFNLDIAPVQNSGSFLGAISLTAMTAVANSNATAIRYPVPMRATPTVTMYNPSAANANWSIYAGADSGFANFPAAAGSTGIMHIMGGVAAVGTAYSIHSTAAAEL